MMVLLFICTTVFAGNSLFKDGFENSAAASLLRINGKL
jgi:hypothetical protein